VELLTLEDATDGLYRNVGKELPLKSLLHYKQKFMPTYTRSKLLSKRITHKTSLILKEINTYANSGYKKIPTIYVVSTSSTIRSHNYSNYNETKQ
jgi:hypothetical protein